jgi:hypothetical protein
MFPGSMNVITIETIINELTSAPEPLLAEVLGFIQAAKVKAINESSLAEKLEISRELDKASRYRAIAQLLESFKTDELSLETIDAAVEDVRAELYARQQAP